MAKTQLLPGRIFKILFKIVGVVMNVDGSSRCRKIYTTSWLVALRIDIHRNLHLVQSVIRLVAAQIRNGVTPICH